MGVAGTLDATTVPDRYGLSWQVSPVAVDALMTPGDSATVERVTRAFLDMKKLDVASIEAARGV